MAVSFWYSLPTQSSGCLGCRFWDGGWATAARFTAGYGQKCHQNGTIFMKRTWTGHYGGHSEGELCQGLTWANLSPKRILSQDLSNCFLVLPSHLTSSSRVPPCFSSFSPKFLLKRQQEETFVFIRYHDKMPYRMT